MYESLLIEAKHFGIKRHLIPVDARSTLEGVWHDISAAAGVLHRAGRLSADFSKQRKSIKAEREKSC